MATSAANPTRTPSGLLTFFAGVLLLAIFAAIVVAWISSTAPKEDIEAKRAAGRIATREALTKEALEKLNSDGWVDKQKGLARINISEALKLTVDDLKQKQVKPSSLKVEAPLPVPVPDPNATEPPPPLLPSAPQGAETFPFHVPAAPVKANAPGGQAAPATVPAQPAPAAQPPAQPATGAPQPTQATPAPAAAPTLAPVPAQPAAPAPTPAAAGLEESLAVQPESVEQEPLAPELQV